MDGSLYFVITVIDRNLGNELLDIMNRLDVAASWSVLANGTAKAEMLSYFNLEETGKCVTFAVMGAHKTKELYRAMRKRLDLEGPGNGLAMSIPVDSVAGKTTFGYLTNSPEKREEPSKMENAVGYKFELIVTVLNDGFSDTVMDAAHAAGCPGGTVLRAKGTVAENVKKFFGITIAEEKEIILTVVKKEQKNDIMKAIMAGAGIHSKAHSIVFSLPVISGAGLSMFDTEISD